MNDIWITNKGQQIAIKLLTDPHLLNIQRMLAERARDLNSIRLSAYQKISDLNILTKHHEDDFDERMVFTTDEAYDDLFGTISEIRKRLKKALSDLKVISAEVDNRNLKRLPLREKEN